MFLENVRKKRSRVIAKYRGTKLGKATRRLGDDEVNEMVEDGSAWGKAKNQLWIGIILVLVVILMVIGAGKLGSEKNLFGDASGYLDPLTPKFSESEKEQMDRIVVEGSENLDGGSEAGHGTESGKGIEAGESGIGGAHTHTHGDSNVPYTVTARSRDVSGYLIKKYSLPEGYRFTVLDDKTVMQEDGSELMEVLTPLSNVPFNVVRNRSGIQRDDFLKTVYVGDQAKHLGDSLEQWVRVNLQQQVEVTWTQGVKDFMIGNNFLGEAESQLFKNNVQDLKVDFQVDQLGPEGVRIALQEMVIYIRHDNKGFDKEFSITATTPSGTSKWKVNKHAEVLRNK